MRASPTASPSVRAGGLLHSSGTGLTASADTVLADLTEPALEALAACTRCLISTVGPYIKYGTPVVAACARSGTHYVDSTGEIPWAMDMIALYHDAARASGAVVGVH